MNMPLVSVILPNYNYEKFLQLRIDSILKQSFQDFELIILDDASTDNSKSIIHCYNDHEKVAHIVINQNNSGTPFIQWKKGLELARGKYVWICEADDWAHEEFLSVAVKVLENDSKIGVFFSESFVVDHEGNVRGPWKERYSLNEKESFSESFTMKGENFVSDFLINKNYIPNASGVLFRRELVSSAGGLDEEVKFCADWLLWIKILLQSEVFYCEKALNYYRRHMNSVIGSINKETANQYSSWLDPEMRRKLNSYLMEGKYKNIKKLNDEYLYKDLGLEGLWYMDKKNYKKGIPKVIKAYYYSAFQSFYIKSLIRQLLTYY